MNDFENDGESFSTGVTPESTPSAEQLTKSGNRFIDVDNMFDGMAQSEAYDLQDKIYDNYAKAMRMRDREPLEEDRFQSHFFIGGNFEKSIAFGGPKDGYLLGSEVNDVFVPTHFAPSGLREGYRLIKGLVDSEKPAALFITPDLVDTVRKMEGWKVLPFKIKTDFHGDDVEKTLVINKWNALTKIATHHAKSIIREKVDSFKYDFNKLENRVTNLIKKDKANATDIDNEVRASLFSEDYSDIDNGEQYLVASTLAKLRDTKLFDDEDSQK